MGREGMSRRHAQYKMVAMVLGTNIVRKELGLPEAECRVEIQKSAMTAVPGAGIGVGVCTQTKGCGWRPNRADQAIATPGNTATSATKYCARNSLAIVVPAAWHKASA